MFDVGLVVFFIRARASEADFFLFAVIDEIPIDEFAAIIEVNIDEIKGQSLTDGLKSFADSVMALAVDGPAFNPLREDIHGIKRVDKFTGSGESAVGNEIEFQRARAADVEGRSFDGDLIAENAAGFGFAVDFGFEF